MVEKAENKGSSESLKAIQVELGKPFKISPDLSKFHNYTNSIELEIKGLGEGRINLSQEFDFQDYPITSTPAGPFEVKYKCDNGALSPILETLPLAIEVEIDDLTKKQRNQINVILIYDGKNYEGDFFSNEVTLLFPQDPKIFDKMNFIISKK